MVSLFLSVIFLLFMTQTSLAVNLAAEEYFLGETHIGSSECIQQTTAHIMHQQAQKIITQEPRRRARSHIKYKRKHLAQNPHAPTITQYPPLMSYEHLSTDANTRNPQQLGLNFTGGTLSEVNLFPPDSMGVVGPTQFIVAINGLIRSFNKTTGVADGVLNADTDVFFNSVRNGDFTSDPRIRYDRFSNRWFIIMINVPDDFNNNRIMLAVSDTSTITPSTVWSFFFFSAGAGNFFDYPTLGIDVNALYIGGQTFPSNYALHHEHEGEEGDDDEDKTRAISNTGQAFVVQKSSVLGAGPIVVTTFNNLIDVQTGDGPYVPQGVDNFDADATVGYFVAVDNAFFGKLTMRRISDPGGIPTISGNIPLTVPATQFPLLVPHLGNTAGQAGRLDAIDDRLFAAHIRNGHLWTSHNIGVDNSGVSTNSVNRTRNGSRWYEIDVSQPSPTLVQAGTLFAASASNDTNQRFYWIPSVMTSGQGHMALGCSIAGANERINSAVAGRLVNNALGTLQPVTPCTATGASYNPSGDPGDRSGGRRWGDYSYTSLDPSDDMTMWTIQEFCNANNSWAVRITKLIAPPPAKPASASPQRVPRQNASVNVTIHGTSVSGSGFYDPGVGFADRISAQVSGGVVVNSVTYQNPTTLVLNISTVGVSKGLKNVTIINPDGQSITTNQLIKVRR